MSRLLSYRRGPENPILLAGSRRILAPACFFFFAGFSLRCDVLSEEPRFQANKFKTISFYFPFRGIAVHSVR